VVKVELIHGAKSEKQKNKIKEALDEFIMLPVSEDTWDFLGDLLYELKTSGLTVPFQDVLIAAIAIENDCMLWTNDKHFSRIRKKVKGLRLFHPAL
jgi:predicted nucleic acid-binding protein